MRRKSPDLSYLPIVVTAAIIVLVYYRFFFFGKIPFPGDLLVASYSPWFDNFKIPVQNPLISDVFSQFFLWKHLAVDIFKSGQWPLWNPYSFTGTPLLATYHSATLYPLNILLFLPKYFGWGLFIFSQTLLAAINMYIFLTLWSKFSLARIAGAVIFSLGGLSTTWLELGTAVHAIAWLPLSLFLVSKYYTTHHLRYLVLLTMAAALTILAGNPQVTTYSLAIIPTFAIFIYWKRDIKDTARSLASVLLALAVALLVTAPQIFPTLELLHKSIRESESYINQSNFGLLSSKDAMKFFIADFLGHPVTRNYWGALNYLESSGFAGSLSLPLIIFTVFYLRRRRIMLFFLFVLFFALTLIFDNPVSKFIYQTGVPLLTASYASRMLFVTGFSIAVLSALSIDQIIDRREEKRLIQVSIWAWATFIGVLLGILFSQLYIKETINHALSKQYLDFYLKGQDFALANFTVSARNTVIPIIISSTLLISFLIVKFLKISTRRSVTVTIFSGILVILLVFDLARYFLKFNPFVSPDLIFPSHEGLEFIKSQPGYFRIGREHAEIFPPNTWTAYNLSSIEGYDPLYLAEFARYMNFVNGGNLVEGDTSRYAEVATNYQSPYLDIANVRYFVAILRDKEGQIPGSILHDKFEETGYKLIYQKGSFAILENPHVLERAYFAPAVWIVSLPTAKQALTNDKAYDPKRKVVVHEDLSLDSLTGTGSATITHYSPEKVSIKTETASEELLVLADQFDEGWQVAIDGKAGKTVRANLIFRAVKISPGSHEVTFTYQPNSFILGLKVSLVTILLTGILILFAIRLGKF